jgi:2-hydroxyacyl-CoA lyase 1
MESVHVIAQALVAQGVSKVYGIIGFPVIDLAVAIQASGIEYFGFRNEQAAAYSAGVEGYLTQRPGVCLTVSGPGMTNAISGMANALVNGWPMLVISGASGDDQQAMGGFQEFDTLSLGKGSSKWAVRINQIDSIPRIVEKAVRIALTGRPGPVYLEFAADLLRASTPSVPVFPSKYVLPLPNPPNPHAIASAVSVLKAASRPLVIFGKGAAYALAEQEAAQLISSTGLPFLTGPMTKGIISDSSPQNVQAARTTALGGADVILLVGARLNWILHFGLPPRFRPDVKVIQIDIDAAEIGTNVRAEVAVCADAREALIALNQQLKGWAVSPASPWLAELKAKCIKNEQVNLSMKKGHPMSYYDALYKIRDHLPDDAILVCEGASTMDIARTVLPSTKPRSRLDAATFGTMGIGLPSVIAAKACFRHRPVIAVMGDSAFGFSALEIETATRYQLPATIIIINNSGIFIGTDALPANSREIPVTSLNPSSRYELLAEAFGGQGFRVTTLEELERALVACRNHDRLTVINVMIDPSSGKKAQEHFWLTAKL